MTIAMILPEVGQIVHFRASSNSTEVFAALITHVHDQRRVDLCVFPPDFGRPYPFTKCLLRQPGDPVPDTLGYCEWPPWKVHASSPT